MAASLAGAPSLTTVTSSSNVGSYAIDAAQGTLSAPNYSLTFTAGTLTITPAALTISATDATMFAGDALPAFAPVYSGFVLGDDESVLANGPVCTAAVAPTSTPG